MKKEAKKLAIEMAPFCNNATTIAEGVSWDMGHDEWLDDESHWVWEISMDAYENWDIEVKK